jgi:hypothetical protein
MIDIYGGEEPSPAVINQGGIGPLIAGGGNIAGALGWAYTIAPRPRTQVAILCERIQVEHWVFRGDTSMDPLQNLVSLGNSTFAYNDNGAKLDPGPEQPPSTRPGQFHAIRNDPARPTYTRATRRLGHLYNTTTKDPDLVDYEREGGTVFDLKDALGGLVATVVRHGAFAAGGKMREHWLTSKTALPFDVQLMVTVRGRPASLRQVLADSDGAYAGFRRWYDEVENGSFKRGEYTAPPVQDPRNDREPTGL